jgi:hypothetical protein
MCARCLREGGEQYDFSAKPKRKRKVPRVVVESAYVPTEADNLCDVVAEGDRTVLESASVPTETDNLCGEVPEGERTVREVITQHEIMQQLDGVTGSYRASTSTVINVSLESSALEQEMDLAETDPAVVTIVFGTDGARFATSNEPALEDNEGLDAGINACDEQTVAFDSIAVVDNGSPIPVVELNTVMLRSESEQLDVGNESTRPSTNGGDAELPHCESEQRKLGRVQLAIVYVARALLDLISVMPRGHSGTSPALCGSEARIV